MPKFRDLFKTDELAVLLNVAHTAINHPVASLVLKHEMKGSDQSFHYWKAMIQRMYDAAQEIGEAELKRQAEKEAQELDINLNEYLSFADLLISFEAARLAFGDHPRRWLIEELHIDDEEADEVYNHLSRLLAAVRFHSQKRVTAGAKTLPALESGHDADIS